MILLFIIKLGKTTISKKNNTTTTILQKQITILQKLIILQGYIKKISNL